MAVDADRFDVLAGKSLSVCGGDKGVGNSKLAGGKTGGNLRVGWDFQGRVHPKCNPGGLSDRPRYNIQLAKLIEGINRYRDPRINSKGEVGKTL